MSEVKRYVAIGGMMPVDEGCGEGVYVRDGDFRVVKSELDTHRKDLDRVTAERDALQQRLTAADERADVLEGLLSKAHPFTYGLKGEQADLWLEIFNALLKP